MADAIDGGALDECRRREVHRLRGSREPRAADARVVEAPPTIYLPVEPADGRRVAETPDEMIGAGLPSGAFGPGRGGSW